MFLAVYVLEKLLAAGVDCSDYPYGIQRIKRGVLLLDYHGTWRSYDVFHLYAAV